MSTRPVLRDVLQEARQNRIEIRAGLSAPALLDTCSTRRPGAGAVTSPVAAGLVEQVLAALAGRTFAGRNEVAIQDRVAAALTEAGVEFAREYRLSERDRPDFLVGGRVVVEVKLKTPRSAVVRQLGRYAEHDSVGAIVLASPSFTTLRNMRMTIHGVAVVPAVLHGPGLVI